MREAGCMSKILVVDDERSIRFSFEIFLSDAGYEVQSATDGDKAIRIQREWQADLVITDIVMPEEDGLGLIRALRKEFPQTRIIAISGALFESDCHLKAAELLGAAQVLLKPITKDQLLQVVAENLA
jgi:YesN/AraC family two-component response regulator